MNRGTLLLTAAVLGLGSYAYFVEFRGKQQEEEVREQQSTLIPFSAPDVTEVEISQGETQPLIHLKREGSEWRMLSPLQDLADRSATLNYVSSVLNEKVKSTVKEGADINWEAFGLHQPIGRVSLKVGDVQKSVEVSGKKNFQDDLYVRRGGEDKLLIGTNIWSDLIKKEAFEFRDKNIFHGKIDDVTNIKVTPRNSSMAFELNHDGAQWILKDQKLKLNQGLIRQKLTQISEIRAVEFIIETASNATYKELKKYGVLNPEIKVDIQFKDGRSWTSSWAVVKSPQVMVLTQAPDRLVRVEGVSAQPVLKLTADSLRDREEPFLFDRSEIKKIILKTKLKTSIFDLKDSKWQVEGLNDNLVVDQSKVALLLEKIRSLRVHQFEEAKKFVGVNSIQLMGPDGKEVFSAQWSEGQENIPFMTSKYPFSFTVEHKALSTLPLHDLIQPTAKDL